MGFLEGQTVLQLWDFRSWLLFRCWKNKDCENKVDKCDKTAKSRGWNNSKFIDLFTPASATASSLDSPMGNAPGKFNTGDYPMYERKTMSAVSLPKFDSFL